MKTPFLWTCPFCNRGATITDSNHTIHFNTFNCGNKDGTLYSVFEATVCPNAECREYAVTLSLHKSVNRPNGISLGTQLQTWQLRPMSNAKPFPSYIPKPLLDDYAEACLIRNLSPKASATLSRSCLQGIIRDFWGIQKNRLMDEINELQSKVDRATWEAIDAVRSIGNIGAHMEKDINLVIDVEPEEAQLLIDLVEILLNDWYVARNERQQHLTSIVALAATKKAPNGAAES